MTTDRTSLTNLTRDELLERHRDARARREVAVLGSDEFRAAAEDIAYIEVELNRRGEPESGQA
jgi:hypothetical protein